MDRLQDNSPSPPNRKPWLAFLMSFVLPGAGQLYTGHATRGLIWYLAITTYGFGFMHWHTPWINFGVKGFVFAWSLVLLGHFLAGAEDSWAFFGFEFRVLFACVARARQAVNIDN